jgi:hypothetical protein
MMSANQLDHPSGLLCEGFYSQNLESNSGNEKCAFNSTYCIFKQKIILKNK